MILRTALISVLFAGAASAGTPAEVKARIDAQIPDLLETYHDLHLHPELSHQEEHTSAFIAAELRKAGFTVTEHIGKYDDGSAAYGVAGVLKNGPGPVVLLRTELDALPVVEATGLPFSSTVRSKNQAGQDVGVMHACGHDLHMTSFLGTARVLAASKDLWSGTLVMIGQPSEETIDGAHAMLNGGLYSIVPKPDFAIAMHDEPTIEAGKVGVVSGPVYAGASSVEVTIKGISGHGAHPEATKDPIVMAAQYIMAIQTIVSRQTLPLDPAVVTVGSIHGGSKNNIIPDEVTLGLTVRAFNEDVRENILSSLKRMANGVAMSAGMPEDRYPTMRIYESTPITYNDPKLTERLKATFASTLGTTNVIDARPVMVSEDFGQLGLQRQIPVTLFMLGASSTASLHSSKFYPKMDPALKTGITAEVSAILDLLRK
ncbi:MAG TPA: amidohydrolase [Candidatus Limnocylindrales bacterium]|nr:amidohydrolase [Candidatus Limnocylindrales bacterium]